MKELEGRGGDKEGKRREKMPVKEKESYRRVKIGGRMTDEDGWSQVTEVERTE